MPVDRETYVAFRTSIRERAYFRAVAEAAGITMSELVRTSFATEGARLGVTPPPEALASR